MSTTDLEHRASRGEVQAQLCLAADLDRQGRHDDAINWLSRAAQAGDAGALAALGFRLLAGRDAPVMPREGAGLLSDAAARGHGEAAAMIAVLAGGGFYGPQSWSVALDFLQRAAELGDPQARAQLRLLSGGDPDPADAPIETWRRLRKAVDVSAWTSAAQSETICDAPLVRTAKALVPPEVCDWVIAQSRPRLEPALVQDLETGQPIMGKTRTNRLANFGLMQTSLVNMLIQARISGAVGVPSNWLEAFAVLNYRPGEQASEHHDFLDPSVPKYAAVIAEFGQRIATCLLYLNDDYAGGETSFPELGVSHRGAKGDALIFSSVHGSGQPDPRSIHAGRPPTSGVKWVLSQFIRDRPVAPGSVP